MTHGAETALYQEFYPAVEDMAEACMRTVQIATLLVFFLVLSCARGQLSTPMPVDPETAAEIVIIRKKHYVGGAKLTVYVDQQDIISMKMGDVTKIRVSPGLHSIGFYVKGPFQKSNEYLDNETTVDCRAGVTKFITLLVGFDVEFEEIDLQKAAEFMQTYNYIPLYQ